MTSTEISSGNVISRAAGHTNAGILVGIKIRRCSARDDTDDF